MTTRFPLSLLLLPTFVLPLTGCSTVVKQAFREAKGAKGTVLPTHEVADGALLRFNSLRFDKCASDLGDLITPPEMLVTYDAAAAELANDAAVKRDFPGGEPALRVASQMLYFQKKGIMSGAEALARVRFFDGDKLLVDSIVRSESDAFRAGDEGAMTDALIDAIGKFVVEKKYTAEQRKEAEKRAKQAEKDKRQRS